MFNTDALFSQIFLVHGQLTLGVSRTHRYTRSSVYALTVMQMFSKRWFLARLILGPGMWAMPIVFNPMAQFLSLPLLCSPP